MLFQLRNDWNSLESIIWQSFQDEEVCIFGFTPRELLQNPKGIAYRLKLSADTKYGLDIFPAVAGGGMKLGKQVKLPLSVHRKGGRSFFIPDVINVKVDDWIHLPEQLDFWKIQDDILETYIPNDLEYLWKCLNISPEKEESDNQDLN